MNFWNKVPLFRFVIPFILGILFAINYRFLAQSNFYYFVVISVLLLFVIRFFKIQHSYSLRWIFGLLLNVIIFFAGYFLVLSRVGINQPLHFSKYLNENDIIVAKIIEYPEEKEKTFKSIVKVKYVKSNSGIHKTTGKALVYFRKDSLTALLKYGDI
ncbi:MAG: DUF4131 domain-containing protein, partial [Bacteroidota bacterium]|nr:DUF4131 domain-containing protein [Bacteroidota bacterium]